MSRTQRVFTAVKCSDTRLLDTCPYTFGKTHRKYTTKSDPKVNYRLGMIVVCVYAGSSGGGFG